MQPQLFPAYVVWELTLRCDQRCTHCGSRADEARPDELTRAQALELIAGWIGAGAFRLIVTPNVDHIVNMQRNAEFRDIYQHRAALVLAVTAAVIAPTVASNGRRTGTWVVADSARFNQLFHGLLDRGVYIAPALYEAGFVSAAHTAEDIAATVDAARAVFQTMR